MKRILKSERAFTLIEMLIVLTVISILLLIIVPNMTKNSDVANEKSCEATIKMLQGQVGVYISDKGSKPNKISDLAEYLEGYSSGDKITCPDKTPLHINSDGQVVKGEDPNNG